MKLIRLTEDRYMFDAGPSITARKLEMFSEFWKEWWAENPGEIPAVITIGGIDEPLVYEDRREPDIESRLRALEEAVFFDATSESVEFGPRTGIEQYQAEDR